MANPTTFHWVNPTENVDGTPIATGEVTAYQVGIRNTADAGSAAGTYTVTVNQPDPTLNMIAIPAGMAPGTYAAAVRAIGPVDPNSAVGATVDSGWSNEASFVIAAVVVTPPAAKPPTNFYVA